MAPAWHELEAAHAQSDDTIIAEVDCTASETQSLCERFKINGYPTIKYSQAGYDGSLMDYEGEKSFEALLDFVGKHVKAACVAANRAACDPEQLEMLDSVRRARITRASRPCRRGRTQPRLLRVGGACTAASRDERGGARCRVYKGVEPSGGGASQA